MKKIGLFPHLKKAEAIRMSARLGKLLEEAGFEVWLEEAAAARLGRKELGLERRRLLDTIDLGIVLGGDGALLYVARSLYPRRTPIFGLNLGFLGFLTEVEGDGLELAVEHLKNGEYYLEDRIMITAEVRRDGELIETLVGLNDMVVTKGAFSRMLRLETWIDGHLTAVFQADGLIVCTPTGSTAYSLSAGGPIVDPKLSVLTITPICAHTFFARPLVVGGQTVIEVKLASNPSEVMLTADGQEGVSLQEQDLVRCYTASSPTRLVKFKERSFYELLRMKLTGERD